MNINSTSSFGSFENPKVDERTSFHKQVAEKLSNLKANSEDAIKVVKLASSETLTEEHIPIIFKIENLMRELLTIPIDFEDKATFQKIYDLAILPTAQKAKEWIKKNPMTLSSGTAASKGKAAQAGFQSLMGDTVISPDVGGQQKVFLLKQQTVLKQSDSRAKEEERLIGSLLDLLIGPNPKSTSTESTSTVPIFHITEPTLARFGMQIPKSLREAGYSSDKIPLPLKEKIVKKLSDTDKAFLKDFEALPKKQDESLKNYEEIQKQKWSIKNKKTGKWKEISFRKLRKTYHKIVRLSSKEGADDSLFSDFEIAPTSELEKGISIKKHMLIDSPLFRALNYIPTLEASSDELYLVPDFSHDRTKTVYDESENMIFIYKDDQDQEQQINFKIFYSRHLLDMPMKDLVIKAKSFDFTYPPEQVKAFLDIVDQMKWKVVGSKLITTPDETTFSELTDIDSKPFIKMRLVNDFKRFPKALKKIFDRLTPDAEFNLIMTGEVQLLDLHGGNLGVNLASTSEYERFKDLTFTIGTKKFNFYSLIIKYLNDEIPPSTLIKFTENGVATEKQLKDLPDLEQALNGKWNVVIFDTDFSLTDSNVLQELTVGGKKGHLIPLRSCVLESSSKDHPLSKEAIERLIDSDERDSLARHWIEKSDAPIYKRISEETEVRIKFDLHETLETYRLSDWRKSNGTFTTIKDLEDDFSLVISDVDNPKFKTMWEKIEKDLSSVPILQGDTFEIIAKRHHVTIEELQRLNPSLLTLTPGKKIKIKYDLHSNTPVIVARRRRIARQLFPRLTPGQQEALVDRQDRRKDYLKKIQELEQSKLEGVPLLNQIKNFIELPYSPFSSIEKEKLLKEVNQLLSQVSPIKESQDFRKKVYEMAQPTYFNLMKVMYPLLADNFALNIELFGPQSAGKDIGKFDKFIESAIEEGLKEDSGSDAYKLAEILQKKITAALPSAAFFGYFG